MFRVFITEIMFCRPYCQNLKRKLKKLVPGMEMVTILSIYEGEEKNETPTPTDSSLAPHYNPLLSSNPPPVFITVRIIRPPLH
jgi:hypothetical protein